MAWQVNVRVDPDLNSKEDMALPRPLQDRTDGAGVAQEASGAAGAHSPTPPCVKLENAPRWLVLG